MLALLSMAVVFVLLVVAIVALGWDMGVFPFTPILRRTLGGIESEWAPGAHRYTRHVRGKLVWYGRNPKTRREFLSIGVPSSYSWFLRVQNWNRYWLYLELPWTSTNKRGLKPWFTSSKLLGLLLMGIGGRMVLDYLWPTGLVRIVVAVIALIAAPLLFLPDIMGWERIKKK